jgi:hypothetical protein
VKAGLGLKDAGPNGGFYLLLGHGAMAVEVMLGWMAPAAAVVPGCKCKQGTQAALPPRGARAALEAVRQNSRRTTSRPPMLANPDIGLTQAAHRLARQAPRGVRGGDKRDRADDPIRELTVIMICTI